MPSRFAILTCVLAGLASGTVFADARINYRTIEGTKASLQSIYIGHGKIRTDANATSSVILDPKAGGMIILDHAKKTFTRFGQAEIDQLTKTLEDVMKQMEQAMASVPPEMRERMKGMMGGMNGMTVSETGQRGSVAGHPCRIVRIEVGGRPVNETCFGDIGALDLPAADKATLTAAADWSKQLAEKLSQGPMGRYVTFAPFQSGMPLRSTDISTDGARSTAEFVGVTAEPLAASLFDIPAGYKEQKIEIPRIGR